MCIHTHAHCANFSIYNIIEKFMSLNGMTLFELSRGRPKIIKVRHAVMYNVILLRQSAS